MSLLSKIFTAIRGGATEAGQAVVDKNAIRILEQEIRDAENYMDKAKRDLTEVMAKEMQAGRRVEEINKEVSKYEEYAKQALAKGDETLALEIATKIADIQAELQLKKKEKESFAGHVVRLKDMIRKTNASLSDMKRQMVMVKTTDSVHKATKTITDNYASSGSKMLSAKESLDRIKQRQQDYEDRMSAGEALQDEFTGQSLEDKLADAGLSGNQNSANDILAKLKAGGSSS